MVPKFREAQ